MKITITKSDIRKGVKCNFRFCPVAKALRRITKRRDVWVDLRGAKIKNWYYDLPEVARCFISDFDLGHPVQPFSFDLPVL